MELGSIVGCKIPFQVISLSYSAINLVRLSTVCLYMEMIPIG